MALSWVQNPVSVKELRSRMRGGSTYWGMSAYVLVLSAATGFALRTKWSGRDAFIGLSMFQLYLAAFVAPTLTAGAITGEREHLTLDLLRITRLSSREIVLGKLASSLSYLMLLIASSVPVSSLVFLLGGVSLLQVAAAYAVIASTAVLFGAVGMLLSAVCRRTATAVFLACAAPLFVMVIWPFYVSLLVMASNSGGSEALDLAVTLLFGVVPVAVAVTLVLRWGLSRLQPMVSRFSSGLIFFVVCAALMVPLAALLVAAQPIRSSVSETAAFCFCPIMAVDSILRGSGAHPLLRLLPNVAIYWFGIAALYLLVAADLIALAVLCFNRIRVKG